MIAILSVPFVLTLANIFGCPPEAVKDAPCDGDVVVVAKAAESPKARHSVVVVETGRAPRAAVAGEGCAPERIVNPPMDRSSAVVWQGRAGGRVFAVAGANGDGAVAGVGTPEADDDDEDTNTVAPQPIEAGGPWLGIQFGPVPEALAAHLDTKNGMLLLNIAKQSPADLAGLQQYDVVTTLGGRDVGCDIGSIMDAIKDLRSGQAMEVQLIRHGKPLSVTLNVGTRPEDVNKLEYKYKSPPEVASTQLQAMAPKFFTWKNGALAAPDDESVKQLQRMLPQLNGPIGQGGLNILGGGDKSYMVIRQTDDDGRTIEIRTESDGKIKVSRSDKDGDRTSRIFATSDELKKEDPEAFKLFDDSHAGTEFMKPDGAMSWNYRWNDKEFDGRMKQALEAYRRASRDAPAAAMKADKALKELDVRMHGLLQDSLKLHSAGASFRTRDDGSIEVVTRDGEDELVQVFEDEAALKSERPDLYKRFDKIRASHEGETDK